MEAVQIVEGPLEKLIRDDVDTDQIVPKQFLKRIERSGYGEFLFWDWVRSGEIDLQPAPVLLAGRNFGCGSSREHAVWALRDFGFQAIVAPSFSDIFYSNAAKNGLLLVAISLEEYEKLQGVEEVRIDLPDQTITSEVGVMEFDFHPEDKERLLQGLDEITETIERRSLGITEWEKDHPLDGFSTRSLVRRLERSQ